MDTYHERSGVPTKTDGQTAFFLREKKKDTVKPSLSLKGAFFLVPIFSRSHGKVQMKLREVSKVAASAGAFSAILKTLRSRCRTQWLIGNWRSHPFHLMPIQLSRTFHLLVLNMKLHDTDHLEHDKLQEAQ